MTEKRIKECLAEGLTVCWLNEHKRLMIDENDALYIADLKTNALFLLSGTINKLTREQDFFVLINT